MYHGKMTAHMYNIWSLAYRTHSLIFVRHRYDLFCVYFIYNGPSYAFCVIVSYHSYLSKCSVRPSGLRAVMQRGYSGGTDEVHWGYSRGTVGVQEGVHLWWWWWCGGGVWCVGGVWCGGVVVVVGWWCWRWWRCGGGGVVVVV